MSLQKHVHGHLRQSTLSPPPWQYKLLVVRPVRFDCGAYLSRSTKSLGTTQKSHVCHGKWYINVELLHTCGCVRFVVNTADIIKCANLVAFVLLLASARSMVCDAFLFNLTNCKLVFRKNVVNVDGTQVTLACFSVSIAVIWKFEKNYCNTLTGQTSNTVLHFSRWILQWHYKIVLSNIGRKSREIHPKRVLEHDLFGAIIWL